jgi:hypothetical protein
MTVYSLFRGVISALWRYLVGAAIVIALLAAFYPAPEPVMYREVVVVKKAITDRELPEKPPIIQRIVTRVVEPKIYAVAPAAVKLELAVFCAPVVALHVGDTSAASPKRELVRATNFTTSWFAFRPASLFISSMTNTGDLAGRDYDVRNDYRMGTASGTVVVREPRLLLGLAKESVRAAQYAALLYGAIKIGQAIVP